MRDMKTYVQTLSRKMSQAALLAPLLLQNSKERPACAAERGAQTVLRPSKLISDDGCLILLCPCRRGSPACGA